MFVNEILDKRENRINLALFHLLQQGWFYNWFTFTLKLPNDALIYPPKNVDSLRPDLAVRQNGKLIAYIEIELGGENIGQLQNYKNIDKSIRIVSIVGRQSFEGDLSLEEIYQFVKERTTVENLMGQGMISAKYLCQLIREGLRGRKYKQQSIAPVSEKMRKSEIVQRLVSILGDKLSFDITGKISQGTIRAETRKENGLSIKVHSYKGTHNEVSVFFITGNSPDFVNFQSADKMKMYLDKSKYNAIDELVNFVENLEGDMKIGFRKFTKVRLSSIIENIDALCNILINLAE